MSYDAGVAGSAVAFGAATRGFELSAYGFSQRLPVLLSTLIDNVVGLEADGEPAIGVPSVGISGGVSGGVSGGEGVRPRV